METLSLHLCRSVITSSFTKTGIVAVDSTPTVYKYDNNAVFQGHINLDGFASYIDRYEHNISFSGDGKYALFCDSEKDRVLYIDIDNNKLLANIKYSNSPSFSLFSADGKSFIVSNNIGNIGVFDKETFDLLAQFSCPDEISNVALSNNQSKIAVASLNKKIYIYSLESNSLIKTIECDAIAEALCFSKNDTSIIAFLRNGNNIVYNFPLEQQFSTAPNFEWPTTLSNTMSKEVLLLGTRENELLLYTTSKGNKLGSITLQYWGIKSISIREQRVFIGFSDGNGLVLDVKDEVFKAIKYLQTGNIKELTELCYRLPLVFISSDFLELIHSSYEKIFAFEAESQEQKLGLESLIIIVMENDSKKDELLKKLYQSKEIIPFMKKVEKGDFDEACKITCENPLLRQLREFNEFRSKCNMNIALELKVLEQDPKKFIEYRENNTHNCSECVYGVLANAEDLEKNFLQFRQSAKAKNFTTMLEIINRFPLFKQTRFYRRVINYGESLIDRIFLMIQSNNILKAEKYAIQLSQINIFANTGLDLKEQIKNYASFEQACKAEDVSKIFDFVKENPALKTTNSFKEKLQNYRDKYNAAKEQALLGNPKAVLTILGSYFKVDYFEDESGEVFRLALVHEIEKYALPSDEKALLETYHQYFGWDEGYQSVCDTLKIEAKKEKRLEPIDEEYKKIQTLITGKKMARKNLNKKDECAQ